VTVACDASTAFEDAAAVFGPEKGAGLADVRTLQRLQDLGALYRLRTAVDVAALPGAGEAGGTAGSLAALGARLCSAFEVVATAVRLQDTLSAVDLNHRIRDSAARRDRTTCSAMSASMRSFASACTRTSSSSSAARRSASWICSFERPIVSR